MRRSFPLILALLLLPGCTLTFPLVTHMRDGEGPGVALTDAELRTGLAVVLVTNTGRRAYGRWLGFEADPDGARVFRLRGDDLAVHAYPALQVRSVHAVQPRPKSFGRALTTGLVVDGVLVGAAYLALLNSCVFDSCGVPD